MNFTTVRSHSEAFVHSPLVSLFFSGKSWDTPGNQEVKNSNAILLTLLKHKHGDLFSKNTLVQSVSQSVQLLSLVQLFATPLTAAHRASLSITNSRACSNSCPSSQWCHPTISSPVVPFPSCLQSFPASGSFPMCQFFPSGGQSIGASAAASVLPMNTQDWLPLGLNGWTSLLSKGLSRVFSNAKVQKHQFFGTQLSL